MSTPKQAYEASSWDELQALSSLDECKAALKAKETQRIAHKRYHLKKQAVLDLVREKHPEIIDEVSKMKSF